MKKFICLILILIMLPCSLIFVACKKDNGYDLALLKADFKSAVTSLKVVKYENSTLSFDYSKYEENDINYLLDLINTNNSRYSYLKEYNALLENTLCFACEYVDDCAKSGVKVSIEQRNLLKSELNELEESMSNLNSSLDAFASFVKFNSVVRQDETALNISYKNLLTSYNYVFPKAIRFSNSLQKLYFNNVLTNSNPNYFEMASFNPALVINNLKIRTVVQKTNLSQVFVEKYVDGENLADCLTGANFNNNVFNQTDYLAYKNQIQNLNKEFDIELAKENANENLDWFYNKSVEAYNLQGRIENEFNKYMIACSSVDYLKVNEQSSYVDKLNKSIIDGYDSLILNYQVVLVDLLSTETYGS